MNSNPYPFNPYNNYDYYSAQQYIQKQKDKSELKKLSLCAGGALLLMFLIQNLAVMGLQLADIQHLYLENKLFQCSFDILLTIFGMLLPFALMGKKMQKISGEPNPVPLVKPVKGSLTFLAVIAGLGMCMLANYVTSIVSVILTLFGLEASTPDIAMPTGVLGVCLTVARIAVMAGVVEELSLRGFVMGNLRRYGDTFAIVISSFVFAFMHGNLIQTPFALVAGFGLGYFSVKTGSLWTGIIIHILNNLISVCVTYLNGVIPEKDLNLIFGALIYLLIGAGIICFLVFRKKTQHIHFRKNTSALKTGECFLYYLTTPTMLISMAIMFVVTMIYLSELGA